jgi:hypothetical protein
VLKSSERPGPRCRRALRVRFVCGVLASGLLGARAAAMAFVSSSWRPHGCSIDEGFNLTTGDYDGLTPAATDVVDDPRFVDPAGADGVLGGDGAADDDFHLSTGENGAVSAAIEAGSDTAEFLGISGAATEDGARDTGPVDLGYHYDASPRVP